MPMHFTRNLRALPPPSTLPPVVAILGGSFNPAHNGHLHISQAAMRQLGINQLWWMVSPQNPLKSTCDMADFNIRMAHASQLASSDKRIIVTDIEQRLNSSHTSNTLKLLASRYPRTRFIWVMGADNLASIHRWEKWCSIFAQCPILVLDRAPLSHRALHSKASICYRRQRVGINQSCLLTKSRAPIWCFSHIRKHPQSATNLRKMLGKKAFISYN